MERIKVYIVDDHPLIRFGVSQAINKELDMCICGESGEIDRCKEHLTQDRPDIVLLDITLKKENGIELIQYLKDNYPDIPALVLSMHDELIYVKYSLEAGAKGYFHKNENVMNLPAAIRKIVSGGNYISEEISSTIMQAIVEQPSDSNNINTLSDREKEIFMLLGKGKRRNFISRVLFISSKTVDKHIENIKIKLKINSTNEVIECAVKWINQPEIKILK